MKKNIWYPADCIAVIIIVLMAMLKLLGVDGTVDLVLVSVASFYFGHSVGLGNQ